MKKLLSLLGSFGLVATTGLAVVACGTNSSSASYDQLMGWVNDSAKVTKVGDQNEVTNQIVFIGGKKDSDSLSWLGATAHYTNSNNWKDLDKLKNANEVSKIDKELSKKVSENSGISNGITSTSNTSQGSNINNALWLSGFVWKDVIPSNQVVFHSILVDDISSFWTSDLGKKIINGIVKDQVKDAVSFNDTIIDSSDASVSKPEDRIKADNKKKNNELKTSFSGKGPFFLLLSNGKIVGISSGFKNYSQYNEKLSLKTDASNNIEESGDNDVSQFLMTLGAKLYGTNVIDFMSSNFGNSEEVGSANTLIKSAKDLIPDWTTANSNETTDKIYSLAQLSFNVDLAKYN